MLALEHCLCLGVRFPVCEGVLHELCDFLCCRRRVGCRRVLQTPLCLHAPTWCCAPLQVLEILDATPGVPKVTPVFVSLDPNRDSLAQMKHYKQGGCGASPVRSRMHGHNAALQ